MLARLSNDTGGRLTRQTNDLSLGFARAKRDLACQYAIGFYITEGVEDVPRRISVNVLRPGLRAMHPTRYQLRTESDRRESTVLGAFASPDMFASPSLRAHVFLLQPESPKRWDALIAVSFPFRFSGGKNEESVDFGAVVLGDKQARYRFDRRVTLRAGGNSDATERRFMFLEPVTLKPGLYELRVVMNDARGKERPGAMKVSVELPPIVKGDLTLVKTILGRPLDDNVMVRGDDSDAKRSRWSSDEQARGDIQADRGSFEPMLVQRIEESLDLAARDMACRVGKKSRNVEGEIERAVVGGENRYDLPAVSLDLQGDGKVSCQSIFEILPEAVAPGDYTYDTLVELRGEQVEGSLRFAVEAEREPD